MCVAYRFEDFLEEKANQLTECCSVSLILCFEQHVTDVHKRCQQRLSALGKLKALFVAPAFCCCFTEVYFNLFSFSVPPVSSTCELLRVETNSGTSHTTPSPPPAFQTSRAKGSHAEITDPFFKLTP